MGFFFPNFLLIFVIEKLGVNATAARQVILDRASYLRKNHQFPNNDIFNEKGQPILPIGTMIDDLPLPFANLLKENNQPYATQETLEKLRKDENNPKFLQLENRYDVGSIFNNFLGINGKTAHFGQVVIPPEITKVRLVIGIIIIIILILTCACYVVPAVKNLLTGCVYPGKRGEGNESYLSGGKSGSGGRNPYLNNKEDQSNNSNRSAFGEGHAGTRNYSQYGHDTGGNKNFEANNSQLQQNHPQPLPLPNTGVPKKQGRKNKKDNKDSEAKPYRESVMDQDPSSPVTVQSNVTFPQ